MSSAQYSRNKKNQLHTLAYRHLPVGYALVGFFLLGISQFEVRRQRLAALTPFNTSASAKSPQKTTTQLIPARLRINQIVDLPVTQSRYTDDTWSIDDDTINFLESSAEPGKPGNSIFYGHNTAAVLGKLSRIKLGDAIFITLQDGTEKIYTVATKQQVAATEVQYLQQTTTEMLTLYTCAGFLDRERLVIQAIPLAIH